MCIRDRLGDYLVDMHGPHDHQSLLDGGRQLQILDAFGKLEPDLQAFGEPLKALRDLQGQKASLVVDDQTYMRELELLRHQVREISQAQLSPEQAQELEAQNERHLHADKLLELSQGVLHLLNEQEGSLWDLIGTIGRNLDQIRSLDAATQSMEGIHQELANQVSELEQALSHYVDRLDLDPALLQELEEAGESENTIIFFYSDHGTGLPRLKRWLFDTGVKVPFIVYIPEKYKSLYPSNPVRTLTGPILAAAGRTT